MHTYNVKRVIHSKFTNDEGQEEHPGTVQQIAEYFTEDECKREIARCQKALELPEGAHVTYHITKHTM